MADETSENSAARAKVCISRMKVALNRQLGDPLVDLLDRSRRIVASQRGQQHEQHIFCVTLVEQRKHRRVRGVAAVPVRLAIDIDGMMNLRQACRSHEHVDRQLMLAKDPQLAGGGLRGRDEQLERAACAHGLEVDEWRQQIAQRVEFARVDLCGREVARPTMSNLLAAESWIASPVSLDHDGGRHQFADLGPEAGQGFSAPAHPPLSQPSARTTAFIAPALLPLRPSNCTLSSSSNDRARPR